MIPLSVCSIAWRRSGKGASQPVIEVPLTELIPQVRGLGFDGIEIWEPHLAAIAPEALPGLKECIAEHGLRVPMVSGYYDFTGDADRCAESLAHGMAVLGRIRAVDGTGMRIFTGKRRSGDCTPEARERCILALRQLCERAAADGIRLCAEVHDWNLTDTADACLSLIRDVDHPGFGLIYHPSMFTPDPVPVLHGLWPWVFHIHATNPPGGLADGPIDWPRLVAVLVARRYSGWLSVEWFGPDPEVVVQREAAVLRAALATLAPRLGAT